MITKTNNKRILVLIANAYPFGTWEPYLSDEIDTYEGFDHIHLFSLSVRPSQLDDRREIRNTKVIVTPIYFRHWLLYLLNAIGALLERAFYTEVLELFISKRLSLRRLIDLVVFLSRARYETRVAARVIDRCKCSTDPQSSFTFYSYRFAYQPLIGKSLQKRFGGHTVARAHGADLYLDRHSRGYIPLRKQVIDSCDRIYPISSDGARYLVEMLQVPAGKVVLSRLGTLPFGTRSRYFQSGHLTILTCSTITDVKRLPLLAEALCAEDLPSIDWIHFGDGPRKAELMYAARTLPPNIKFRFMGHVSREEIETAYIELQPDLLINVSSSEGVAVSIMEAISFGVPVIATKVGGTPEIVIEGVTGTLISGSPSPEEIASAIRHHYELPPTVKDSLSKSSRLFWKKNYCASLNYKEFNSSLQNLSGSQR